MKHTCKTKTKLILRDDLNFNGPLAQLVERTAHNRLVAGSSPARSISMRSGLGERLISLPY